jgi:hypothetical protein
MADIGLQLVDHVLEGQRESVLVGLAERYFTSVRIEASRARVILGPERERLEAVEELPQDAGRLVDQNSVGVLAIRQHDARHSEAVPQLGGQALAGLVSGAVFV